MKHEDFQAWVEMRLDGLLTPDQSVKLESHLTGCADCRAHAEAFESKEKALRRALSAGTPRPNIAPDVIQKLVDRIRVSKQLRDIRRQSFQVLRSISWAALTVLLAVSLNWLFTNFTDPLSEPSSTITTQANLPETNPSPTEIANRIPPIPSPDSADGEVPAPVGPPTASTHTPFSPQLRRTLLAAASPITSVAFSPDGILVAATSTEGELFVWRLRDGALLRSFTAHEKEATSIAFSPDSSLILTGGRDGEVKAWLAKSGAFVKNLLSVPDHIEDIQFSPSGDLIAVTLGSNNVTLVRVSDGQRLDTFESSVRLDVRQAPDRNSYLIASSQSAIWLQEESDIPFTLKIFGQSGRTLDLVLSSGGSLLASASTDGLISLWKIYDLTVVDEPEDPGAPAQSSRMIVGDALHTLTGHDGWVNALDFSADSRYLVSGGEDGLILLWWVREGRLHETLSGHAGPVTTVDISPDDVFIASGSEDGTVRIWALEDTR